jgi:hypothetical protein
MMEMHQKRAKILPFKSGKEDTSNSVEVSETTRDIFSETWRLFIDEPTLTAIKMEPKTLKAPQSQAEEVADIHSAYARLLQKS